MEEMRAAWRKRAEQAKKDEEQRRRQAMAKAKAVARHLKEKYHVTAVYLYGSLVWGRHFTAKSDIDLLVKDFPPEASFWRMLVEVEAIGHPFEISIVDSVDAFPSLRQKAEREGVEL